MDSSAPANTSAHDNKFSVINLANNLDSLSFPPQQDHQKENHGQCYKTLTGDTILGNTMATGSSSSTDTITSDGVLSRGNMELIYLRSSSSSSDHHHLKHEISKADPEILLPAPSPITNRSTLRNVGRQVCRAVTKLDGVVKVYCARSQLDYVMPRQRKRQITSYSSGFVIKGRRISTTAHSVKDYVHVKLRKRVSHVIYAATVLAVGNDCGVALLTVDDDEFWEGVSLVEFGGLPAPQDPVAVVGYPVGGDTISVTSGVVPRIEILSYFYGATGLLGIQDFLFSGLSGRRWKIHICSWPWE